MISSIIQNFESKGQLILTNGATINAQVPFLFDSNTDNKVKKSLYFTVQSDSTKLNLISFGGDQGFADIKQLGFRQNEKDSLYVFSYDVIATVLSSEIRKDNVTQTGFFICKDANTTIIITLYSPANLSTEG